MVKGAGQSWGGSYITLDSRIDFSTNKTFKVKVYSPRVGAKLLLKVENLTDGNIAFDKEVATTKANEWEEGDMKNALVRVIANHMKKSYLSWNKDTVDDKAIFDHLYELSGGRIDLHQSTEKSNVFVLHEIWENESIFEKHNNQEYVKAFFTLAPSLLEKEAEIIFTQPIV